ncbi:hypothetical protein ACSQ67_024375 [Phaseolus vulgaris]
MSFNSVADLVRPRPTSLDRAFRGTQAITFNILYLQVRSVAIETNPLHAFVAFSFFALLGFIQIRYPENPSPFQLHPKTTIISIATFLLYCLGFLGSLKFRCVRIVVHHSRALHYQNPFKGNMGAAPTNKKKGGSSSSTVTNHFMGYGDSHNSF